MPQSPQERKATDAERKRAYRLTSEYRAWRHANRERINEYKRHRRAQQNLSNPDSIANRQTARLRRSLATLTPSPSVAELVHLQHTKHIEATLYSRQKSKLRKALMRQCAHLGHISGRDMRHRYQQFDNACAYCQQKPPNPLHLEIEHVIPLSAGGPHCLSNIVPACKDCNSSKRDKPWLSWYKHQPFYSFSQQQRIQSILASTPYPPKQLDLLPSWVLAG